MSRTWISEYWQLVIADVLTADSRTKIDTAKLFQVNMTVNPDVTILIRSAMIPGAPFTNMV